MVPINMDQDQLIARDRHLEIITSITALRAELTATRLEVKTDLQAARLEHTNDLAAHQLEDAKAFGEIRDNLNSMQSWKARSMAYASVVVFVLTTVTAFMSAALASGRI
jgi:hypothetical protein